MKRKIITISIIIVSQLFLSSCFYSKITPMSVMSSSHAITSEYEVLGEAEGFSSEFKLLWIIPVTSRMSIEDALDDAIRSKGGNAIIEVTAQSENEKWIVGTIDSIRIQGKVIRFINR